MKKFRNMKLLSMVSFTEPVSSACPSMIQSTHSAAGGELHTQLKRPVENK